MPTAATAPVVKTNCVELFKYPRSLLVVARQFARPNRVYGIILCAPSLFVLLLDVSPNEASKMMILLTVARFVARLCFSYFSDRLGRRVSGGMLRFRAGIL